MLELITINEITDFAFVFVWVLIGVYFRDYINTLNKDFHVYKKRIVFMSIIITVFMLSLKESMLEHVNSYTYIFN